MFDNSKDLYCAFQYDVGLFFRLFPTWHWRACCLFCCSHDVKFCQNEEIPKMIDVKMVYFGVVGEGDDG